MGVKREPIIVNGQPSGKDEKEHQQDVVQPFQG